MLCACTKSQVKDKDSLVVEGWICQKGHPVVLIHKSYALNNPEHQNDDQDVSFEELMAQQLIMWGKVIVDDGDQQVVLTGRIDTMYMPPIVYTTTEIIGEVGKTYSVQVDYGDYHATAYSTIQKPIGIDSLVIRRAPNLRTSHVVAYLSHLPSNSYFLAEYRAAEEHQFSICPLGTASSAQMQNGVLSINILSKNPDVNTMTSALHHFEIDEREYFLRIIHLNYEQYQYFSALTSQLAAQGVFFMSSYKNIPTNIDGGIGYWAGFGAKDYLFKINKDTTYIY